MTKKKNGFTLIEVLMALAVIGILSAIVTTNLRGVKDKARINKGLEFSQGLYTSLGSNASLYFDFENVSGGTVADRSGNNNDALLINGASIVSAIVGSGVSFDGINDYLDLGIPLFKTYQEKFTVALWVYPNAIPATDQVILHNLENGAFKIGYDHNGEFFFSYKGASTGWHTFSSGVMFPGKWYHVAVRWDETDNISQIFIDGATKNTVNPGEVLASDVGTPVIGAERQGAGVINNFNGIVDDVRAYIED